MNMRLIASPSGLKKSVNMTLGLKSWWYPRRLSDCSHNDPWGSRCFFRRLNDSLRSSLEMNVCHYQRAVAVTENEPEGSFSCSGDACGRYVGPRFKF